MDRLNDIIVAQWTLQQRLGHNFEAMTVAERVEYIRTMVLATTSELHEALNETSWKPWAKGEPWLVSERVLGECVDAFHFLINIVLAASPGASPETVAARFVDGYFRKNTVNHERAGDPTYDGKTGKCPRCKRDLAEVGVRTSSDSFSVSQFCRGCDERVFHSTVVPAEA